MPTTNTHMRSICLVLGVWLAAGCSNQPPEMNVGSGAGTDAGGLTRTGDGQLMQFAVVGDSRPPNLNQTTKYPAAIVAGNFKLMQSMGAQFAVATGDYMFANDDADVQAQLDQYFMGEMNFTGPVYRTMGNHECTGATASNCPAFDETPNMKAFMTRLLPSGMTTPYYRIDIDTPFGKAKFVFVAANAWSDTQATWLQQQLADSTVYTFVMRHEPPDTTETPGVTPSENIIHQFPLTLELLGHSHYYRRVDTQHVICGNGGAPISGGGHGSNYGFLMITQQNDGSLAASEIDESTGNPVDGWKVKADGTAL